MRYFVFWLVCLAGVTSHGQTVQEKQGSLSLTNNQSDWPRFLGSGFDGTVLDSGSRLDWEKEPVFQWQIEVGDGYGIASVADDRVYQCDSFGGTFLGGGKERLRCFDLSSGRLIWTQSEPLDYRDLYGYEAGPRSSPTIVDGKVLTFGVSGHLICREAKKGEKIWEVDTNETYGVVQNFFGVGSAPLVLDDSVIVMVGGSPREDQSIPPGQLDRVVSNGTAVVAFDLNTGKEKWKCGEDLASYSSPRSMEINDRKVVLVFARNGLIAIDPEAGSTLWRFDHRASILESVNAMMPIVRRDEIFISECYQVGSVLLRASGKSAEVIWRDDRRSREKSMRSHWSTPVLVGDYLYGCSGRNAPDSDFRCLDFRSGEVKWVDPRRTRSSVTRVGTHLLVMEEKGRFEVMKANPEQMEIMNRIDFSFAKDERPALEYPCWSAPVIVGSRMLVRGDSRVICLQWQETK